MRAALLQGPGEIVVGEIPDVHPARGEVRVRVRGVGLCGSDMSVFSGRWKPPSLPWVMGHEAYGVIDGVGDEVPPDRVGETVVVEPNAVCFACPACESGLTSTCHNRQSVGMNRPGALAEWLVVPSAFAWATAIEDPETLVCVEPLTVVSAALRRLARPMPDRALVVGLGPQGLLMALVLMSRGVEVSGADVNHERLDFATSLGVAPSQEGDGFPLAVDTVGSPPAHATAVDRLAVGGALLVLGFDDRPMGTSATTLVRRQLTMRGSLTYDHPADFRSTLDLLAAHGNLAPRRVVTRAYGLADAQLAFDEGSTAAGKAWIRFV
jgi:threonine dehydrogenase-like Zn-dependent dehydrogenase